MKSYFRRNCSTFRFIKDEFGALSNFAPYPFHIDGILIRTTEALYQAMKFPNQPEAQKRILDAKSPMTAKMIAKGYEFRRDWDRVKVDVMDWCLALKYTHHYEVLRPLLDKAKFYIVEESMRDAFWGAKPVGVDELVGENKLGEGWMKLRYASSNVHTLVRLPKIGNMRLLGDPLHEIRT